MEKNSAISLEKASKKLKEGLALYQNNADEIIRDGLIKRFNFTYELSHKILKRFLKLSSASSQYIEQMDFPDLIAYANRKNLLLGNWSNWEKYRDFYIKTSYDYDEKSFNLIIKEIPNFLLEIEYLLTKIKISLT